MNKISSLFSLLTPSRTVIFILLLAAGLVAQSSVDLDLKIRSTAKSVRGGEKLRYAVSVTNLGPGTATGVVLVHTSQLPAGPILSVTGDCRLMKELGRLDAVFRCEIGSLGPNKTAVINVEMQMSEFGGEEMSPAQVDSMRGLIESLNRYSSPDAQIEMEGKTVVAEVDVRSDENEENRENNRVEVLTRLLPSLNLPPRVKIISPASREIKKRVNDNGVVLTIRASDPDGDVVKVVVSDPAFSPLNNLFVEDGVRKIMVDGKAYTAEEYDNNPKLGEFFERTAKKIGANLYAYTLNDTRFGPNTIFVHALDNQGRTGSSSVHFDVVGDADVKITSPDEARVFRPGDTINIETTSTINDPDRGQIRIDMATAPFMYKSCESMPLARKVSQTGPNVRHRHVWKNAAEGVYQLRVIRCSGEIRTNVTSQLVVVAEARIIKIFSLRMGQEFERDAPVKIAVDATDENGLAVRDKLELVIDGKRRHEVYNARRNSDSPPYKESLHMDYYYTLSNLDSGKHTFQVVARPGDMHDGPILGESEIITIVVK